MDYKAQVWAVDVSNYKLWKDEKIKDDGLIDQLLPTKDEQEKVKRYVREIDQIRCLTGKLLARLAICTTFQDLSWHQLQFQLAQSGRPYLEQPPFPFDYNITHDGDWVAIVFAKMHSLNQSPPLFTSLGIDVMEIRLPHFEKDPQSFVETMEISLTESEQRWILEKNSENGIGMDYLLEKSVLDCKKMFEQEQLRRIFTLWTYKEAFTKAHGLGLSFNFSHLELAMWNRLMEKASILSIRPDSDDRAVKNIQDAQNCRFDEIHLPAGEVYRKGDLGTQTVKGGGTGSGSILVFCSRLQHDVQNAQVPHSGISSHQAEKDGLLRIWSLEDLVVTSMKRIKKRTNT